MNNFPKKISIDVLEQKIEVGEEIIDTYFDAKTTRIGKSHQVISRRKNKVSKNIDFHNDPELGRKLKEMAEDPESQAEMKAINEEFLITEMDDLD